MVTIAVPAYNAAPTLEKCLQAIKGQMSSNDLLLVINDGSEDQTHQIAEQFADQVIDHEKNLGLSQARQTAIRSTISNILIFIDSDIVIKPDTVTKIKDYFAKNSEVSAVTGILAADAPVTGILSDYKNIYMNHTFRNITYDVDFLYGSIFAARTPVLQELPDSTFDSKHFAEDTKIGRKVFQNGNIIRCLTDLEVTHLKEYDLSTFIKTSFYIPYYWATLFLQPSSEKDVKDSKFAHTSKSQIVSLFLAPLCLGALLLTFVDFFSYAAIGLFLAWGFVNFDLHQFIAKKRGWLFSFVCLPITFFDHCIKFLGAGFGAVNYYVITKQPPATR